MLADSLKNVDCGDRSGGFRSAVAKSYVIILKLLRVTPRGCFSALHVLVLHTSAQEESQVYDDERREAYYRRRAAEAGQLAGRARWDDLKKGFRDMADAYTRLAEAEAMRRSWRHGRMV